MATWASGPRYLLLSGFLAVEGVPLAAEEAKDPATLPRGLIGAMLILTAFAMLILFLGAGAAGCKVLYKTQAPLW